MPQGTLSTANVVQAKSGQVTGNTASVALDAGTQAGSTVTIEISSMGAPFTDGSGLATTVPDGFELDNIGKITGINCLWVFRKPDVAAGEGVAGSTAWDFTYATSSTGWCWRVTEWDAALEPTSPLEAIAANEASGSGVTTLSTGTTPTTSRAAVVALAWHYWQNAGGSAGSQAFDWTSHTNSFTERDELLYTVGTTRCASCWSWLFASATSTFECTATASTSPHAATDTYSGLMTVYAATTYA
jgi:hypothetical protein